MPFVCKPWGTESDHCPSSLTLTRTSNAQATESVLFCFISKKEVVSSLSESVYGGHVFPTHLLKRSALKTSSLSSLSEVHAGSL